MSDDEQNSAMDTIDNSDSNENSVSNVLRFFLMSLMCVCYQAEKNRSHRIDGACGSIV